MQAERRVFWNSPFDLSVLEQQGYDPASFEPFEDGMLAASVLGWASKGLKANAMSRLGLQMDSIEDVAGKASQLSAAPVEDVARYAATDAIATRGLWVDPIEPTLALPENRKLRGAYELDRDLVVPIIRAQRRGMVVDREAIKSGITLCEQMAHRAGRNWQGVNLGSYPQVRQVLLDLGLRWPQKTEADEPAVDKEALLWLAPTVRLCLEDEVPPPANAAEYIRFIHDVLYRRRAVRAKNYLTTWYAESAHDGRVRTHFNLAATRTHRLSSSDPLNAQNVPPSLRDAFVAPDGMVILEADYSQVEYRVMAQVAQDPALIAEYLAGGDMHEWMRREAGVDRKTAKMLNFTIMFGGGANKWSEVLGRPLEEMRLLEARLRARAPALFTYRFEIGKELLANGWVETLMGRRRYFPGVAAWDQDSQMEALRGALSMKVQGTAAELLKRALLTLSGRPGKLATPIPPHLVDRWWLTVHDSVDFYLKEDELPEAVEVYNRAMTEVTEGWDVPLVVDFKWGKSWGQLKEWKR